MTKSSMRVTVLPALLAAVLVTGYTAEQAASPASRHHAVVATEIGPYGADPVPAADASQG
ncbi:hypothetical protein OG599_18335 [Streptomyces sp. NBC_01335]|uniref:hypothetical protein n=1 Tax=Streptomyces sp. NBC_01335 TaxID=2903828 RepID=UPI002E0DFEC6|nr:hypothetical protein OG599_18335 [Streptomyces sp. NBC_01335]